MGSYHVPVNTLRNICHNLACNPGTNSVGEELSVSVLRLRPQRLRGMRKYLKTIFDNKLQTLKPCPFWLQNPCSSFLHPTTFQVLSALFSLCLLSGNTMWCEHRFFLVTNCSVPTCVCVLWWSWVHVELLSKSSKGL